MPANLDRSPTDARVDRARRRTYAACGPALRLGLLRNSPAMNLLRIALLAASTLGALPAIAGPASQSLGTCLADNTSGRDRKELAKWIFVAMSAHPDMKDVAGVTA